LHLLIPEVLKVTFKYLKRSKTLTIIRNIVDVFIIAPFVR